MAYAVRQKRGDKVYVYIAENIYRADIKQSRQKRRYIGTLDDEGLLTLGKNVDFPDAETRRLLEAAGIECDPSRRRRKLRCRCGTLLVDGACPLCSGTVSGVSRIGVPHLLGEIASSLSLTTCLKRSFGSKWSLMLKLAEHRAATGAPSYLAESWLDGRGGAGGCSSASVSRLLREVGADSSARERFFSEWRAARGGPEDLACDITSISTRSDRLSLAEWGYNRDEEALPQINISMLAENGAGGMPLAYRLLPGSVPDVSTVANLVEWRKSLGFENPLIALDKGFHSKSNVLRMHERGVRFVIGVPLSLAAAKKLLKANLGKLESGRRSFLRNGRVIRHLESSITYSNGPRSETFKVHLYVDPKRAAEIRTDFEKRMLTIEAESGSAGLETRREAAEWLEERARRRADLFKIVPSGHLYKVERKPNAVSRAMKPMGCLILLTNDSALGGAELLDAYRSKDGVEKMFDTLKNEIGGRRFRTGDDAILEGQFMLSMIALILRRGVEERMRSKELRKNFSVDEVFSEMDKISVIELSDGGEILLELTKKQKDFLRKLGVPQPQMR